MFKKIDSKRSLEIYDSHIETEKTFVTEGEMKKFTFPIFILSLLLIVPALSGCETMKSVGKTVAETVARNICN